MITKLTEYAAIILTETKYVASAAYVQSNSADVQKAEV